MTNFDEFYQLPVKFPVRPDCNVWTILVPKAWGERAHAMAQKFIDAGLAEQLPELMQHEGMIPGTAEYKADDAR